MGTVIHPPPEEQLHLHKGRIVLPVNEYRNLVQLVLHRDKWKCRVCKRRSNLHVHHIVYRSQLGDDASWNLITLCTLCHDGIHKPNPKTGAKLVLLPMIDGERINADGDINLFFVGGWKPYV